MTDVSSLVVCFATQESGGDSNDDYLTLSLVYNQVEYASFEPNSTIAGAETRIVVAGSSGDQVLWMATNCSHASANGASAVQTGLSLQAN